MGRSREWPGLQEHDHAADSIFDALGFSGENGRYDEVDALIAIRDFLVRDGKDATSQETEQWLLGITRRTRSSELADDGQAASVLLGYAIGRKVISPRVPEQATTFHQNLIDRAFQNVQLSHEVYGHGDVRLLYDAFAELAGIYAECADREQYARIRRVVGFAADCRARAAKVHSMMGRESAPIRIWPHVLHGLATIAMVQGYRVVPPPEQTDENGAWDPGHEDNPEERYE